MKEATKTPLELEFETVIYSDGACHPNPGRAGSGIAVYRNGGLDALWYGHYQARGTNNSAELKAFHEALRIAESEVATGRTVALGPDSKYAIDCVTKWAYGWKANGWQKKSEGAILNLEIIQWAHALYVRVCDDVTVTHVRSHVGVQGNELADRMAMKAVVDRVTGFRRFEPMPAVDELLAWTFE